MLDFEPLRDRRVRAAAMGAALLAILLPWRPADAAENRQPQPAFELISIDHVDRSAISELGRQAIKKQGSGALVGRSQHFIAFAGQLRDLSEMIDEAEYAHQRIGRWFDLPPSTSGPSLLMAVKDENLWRRWTRTYGLRQDGLAMQINRELYLKDDAEQRKRPDRIAHEVVHLRLSEAFGSNVPLWLDEGLAGHYGWLCAAEYAGRREVVLYRNQPALEKKELLGLEDLLNLRRYPKPPDRARAFYRQSEDLVGVLADRLGPAGMVRFVRQMCRPAESARAAFREAAGINDREEIALIEAMRERSMTVRKP